MSDTTKTEVTTTITVTDLIPGDPPALMTVKRTINSQGIARQISQRVSVPDQALARRLFAEVQRGDEITLILTTTWTADSYETRLTDFSLPGKRENSARRTKEHHAATLS